MLRDRATRVLLVIAAAGNALVGLWASLAPHSFYDDFPGGGRHWVAADGPFNEHLVRDVGALNLALAVILVAALVRPMRYIVLVAAGGELVYSLPHFVYHLAHLDLFDGADKVALVVTLGITVIAPIALIANSSRAREESITRVA